MESIIQKLHGLVIFRNLLKDEAVSKFMQIKTSPADDAVISYTEFIAALFEKTLNFSEHLLNLVLDDVNFYTKMFMTDDERRLGLEKAAISELELINKLANLSCDYVTNKLQYSYFPHKYETTEFDFVKEFFAKMENIKKTGYGMYARYHMFTFEDGEIKPVKTPDSVTLKMLGGYERERRLIYDNTKAFLDGKPAVNALLYGHSGTGKSSTVKAIANELKDEGLRLIEVKKENIKNIPSLTEQLADSPLKFIIFIDDLSFYKNDDSFSAMKAILEGSAAAATSNMVIYATSNRRHMVKESFEDRQGNEIHITDSIEEATSLSERFGLRIVFSKPDKNQYLAIVKNLAEIYRLDIDEETLINAAERHALSKGGRSARGAKQVVECLACGIYDF